MGRYTKREFQIGEFWIGTKGDSPAWHRCWLDGRQVRRTSLGTADFEEAKRLLTDWYIRNREVKDENPEDASLADIIRRYQEEHNHTLRSAADNTRALGYWLDFWGVSSVADLRNIKQQEKFHQFLRDKGQKASTIQRTILIGKAAVNRAWKRGELLSVPHIASVKVGAKPPKGRPLSLDELRALYDESAEHAQTFIRWMLGTAARPEAILQLHAEQVDREHGLIHLNPEGREQNKKFRATVRLPQSLAGEVLHGYVVKYRKQRVECIKKAMQRAKERAKLEGQVSAYSLRHTAARWMRMQGVHMDEIAQQLGHKGQNRTSEIYVGYDPNYLRYACAALSDLVELVCQPTSSRPRLLNAIRKEDQGLLEQRPD